MHLLVEFLDKDGDGQISYYEFVEKINFRDEEFFEGRHSLIANAPTKFRRKQLIEDLRSIDPHCFR